MAGSGGTTREEQERLRRHAERAHQIREDRAAGRRTVRGAAWALQRYFRRQESLSSARALPIDAAQEGSGRPNRALDDPGRKFDAHMAWAIKLAETDDRERHPDAKPRQIYRWLAQHFGLGRACSWIAEDDGVSEMHVTERVKRARRVVQRRLKAIGALEHGGEETAE
jgi:hypothetical protein